MLMLAGDLQLVLLPSQSAVSASQLEAQHSSNSSSSRSDIAAAKLLAAAGVQVSIASIGCGASSLYTLCQRNLIMLGVGHYQLGDSHLANKVLCPYPLNVIKRHTSWVQPAGVAAATMGSGLNPAAAAQPTAPDAQQQRAQQQCIAYAAVALRQRGSC